MVLFLKYKSVYCILTKYGRSIGGKMSKSNYCSVPTFKFEIIEKKMIDFYNMCQK